MKLLTQSINQSLILLTLTRKNLFQIEVIQRKKLKRKIITTIIKIIRIRTINGNLKEITTMGREIMRTDSSETITKETLITVLLLRTINSLYIRKKFNKLRKRSISKKLLKSLTITLNF